MDNSKSANYTLPLKGLSARPWNIQTIHDALKKCRGDRQTTRNLCIQARQMTDALMECFREELDKIPSLNPNKRENLISDVEKYIQELFKWLQNGQDKEDLDLVEHERLTSEYTFLVNRLRDLQQSAETRQIHNTASGEADLPNSIPAKIWAMLCKLYEITLKVIIDAILDRFWPKP